MNMFSYEGKRVAIVGCFSGIGEACARDLVALGAEVHGADVRESPVKLASFRRVDLKDTASIDAAVDSIGGRIDALFNCAGLPQTFPAMDVLKVNFIGMRHWTERWIPRVNSGGAICSIASNAAYQFQARLPLTTELVLTPDYAAAVAWAETRLESLGDPYGFSKEAIVVYTLRRAVELARQQHIRMNVTLPSPTTTPMMDEFVKVAPAKVFEIFSEPLGRPATPAEQARPLILLNSDAAGFISGLAMPVDYGFTAGVQTGLIDVQALLAKAFSG